MHAHLLMRLVRHAARGRYAVHFSSFALVWLTLNAMGLSAFAGELAQKQALHPANPDLRGRSTPYRSVTSGYVSRRPVAPQPWRGRNDAVAPQEKK